MHHDLLREVFVAARDYHGSLAAFARARRAPASDIERAAQQVVGTSLRYRLALDRLIAEDPAAGAAMLATRARLQRLRVTLGCTARSYNALMK